MVDKHNQSFFVQSPGMFVQSSSKSEPFIFLQFIKKKENGTWEKLSLKEGKTMKCNLEEIIMILRVLEGKIKSWSTVHVFKEEKTSISVSWEGDHLWVNCKELNKKEIYEGRTVKFNALVYPHQKSYNRVGIGLIDLQDIHL